LGFEGPWRVVPVGNADISALSGNGDVVALYNHNDSHITVTNVPKAVTEIKTFDREGYAVESLSLSRHGGAVTILEHTPTGVSFSRYWVLLGRPLSFLLPVSGGNMNVTTFLGSKFSGDGDAIVVAGMDSMGGDDDDDVYFRAASDETGGGQWMDLGRVWTEPPRSAQLSPSSLPDWSPFLSISWRGRVLAESHTSVTKLHESFHRCGVDQVAFRILTTLDEFPVDVSYSLTYMWEIGDTRFSSNIDTCDGCFEDNDDYARTQTLEDICVPRRRSNCLVFDFSVKDGRTLQPGAGFATFLISDGNTELFGEGSESGMQFRNFNESECTQPPLQCQDTEELPFVLGLRTDIAPFETTWSIRTYPPPLGTVIARSGDISQVNRLLIEERCLPRDGCYEFIVQDTFGDGICCSSGNGKLAGYFGGVKVIASDGQFGFNQSWIFGNGCQQTPP